MALRAGGGTGARRASWAAALALLLAALAGCGPGGAPPAEMAEKNIPLELFKAVKAGDLQTARALLDKGTPLSPNRWEMGDSLLALAARAGDLEMMEMLLEHGATVDEPGMSGAAPLYWAAWTGQLEAARFLLDRGADPNGREHARPLVAAAQKGELPVLDLLVARGAKLVGYPACDPVPLVAAAREGHLEAVALLLDRGTPPDAGDCETVTALMVACEGGDAALAKLLLSRGADPGARAFHGETCLGQALKKQRPEMVDILLEAQDRRGGGIPAAPGGAEATVVSPRLLLAGAKAGRADWVGRALRDGADVDARDDQGYTPLILAAERGHAEVVRLLLRAKAAPNLVSDYGVTALDAALARRDSALAAQLRAAGGKAGLPHPRYVGRDRDRNTSP